MPDTQSATDRTRGTARNLRFLFLSLAIFSAIFSGIIAGALVMIHLDPRNVHPPETALLAQAKDELAREPGNQNLKQIFNKLDASNRAYLLARARRTTSGAWLLAGGIIALLASALLYTRMDPHSPVMRRHSDQSSRRRWLTPRRRNVIALTTTATIVLMAFAITAGLSPLKLPGTRVVMFKQNWSGFRGPEALAIAPPGDWPVSWDLATGENILWRSEVPLPGKGSPAVWSDRVFLTGGNAQVQEVFCFDRTSGRLLWGTTVASTDSLAWARGSADDQVAVGEFTGAAAPTPVTDGKLVFVCFNTNDLAAVDFSGKIKWVKNLGKPETVYGLSSSPILYKDTLIYQCDQGRSADDNLSAIYGLDKLTGDLLWRTARPVGNSWSSPILAVTATGTQVITTATNWVIAYDPDNGDELWRADVLAGAEVGPSAAYADGTAYATDDEARLSAIRTGGASDVTSTGVVWQSDQGMPDSSSPVCDGKFLVQADSSGLITCFDSRTGKLFWKKQFPKEFWSSPVISAGTLFVIDRTGRSIVIRLAETYDELGTGRFGEAVEATPAFADSVIYVRTEKHLVAIARKSSP